MRSASLVLATLLLGECGTASALIVERSAFTSAAVSIATTEQVFRCSDADSGSSSTQSSCAQIVAGTDSGDATLNSASSSSTANVGFGTIGLAVFAQSGISNSGGGLPNAGGSATGAFTDNILIRESTLPLDAEFLVKVHFGIDGNVTTSSIPGWTTVADGQFGASFTPQFFGAGGSVSCGLFSSGECELRFIGHNGRRGFLEVGANLTAGVVAGSGAQHGSAASVNADFSHTFALEWIEVLLNGVAIDPANLSVTADSGTRYALLPPTTPIPLPAGSVLLTCSLPLLAGSVRRARMV